MRRIWRVFCLDDQRVLSGRLILPLLLIFMTTVLGAMAIEAFSDRYLPAVEFSGMHFMTIFSGGFIATLMAYFALHKFNTLYGTIYSENEERKRAEASLEASRAEAELYVDLMGHDINNMNQVAMGYTELAMAKLSSGEVLDADDLPLLAKTMDMLDSSSKLIESVGKIRKASSGELELQEIDLADVIADIRSTYFKAGDKNVSIRYYVGDDCRVRANWLIKDVIYNLVGNAIKHAASPDVRIDVDVSRVDLEDGRYCQISVVDNGPGISDELKGRIFKRFARGDRRTKGKGLGLYLVKSLTERFQGKVWVEDRVSGDCRQGSRFVVLLPAAP